MMGRGRSSTPAVNTPMPPHQQQQDVAGLVQLLRKHQHFASAAAYNLQCLNSCFHQGGKGAKGDGSGPAEQDAATAELLERAGGIEAIAACLAANTSSDKASNAITLTLVQAASKVLSRFLEVRPSGAARLETAGGLATCVQALRAIDADERPAECMRLLGLMAAADPAYARTLVAGGKGAVLDLLLQTLKAALAVDDRDRVLHATLALGAIAAAGLLPSASTDESPLLACEAALPDLPRRVALGELVLKEMTKGQQDRQSRRVTPRLLRTTTAKAVATAAASGTGAAGHGGGGGGRTSPLFFATTDRAGAGAGEREGTKTQAPQLSSSSSGPMALLRSQVMILQWLTKAADEGGLTERLAQAGTPRLLVEAVGELEDQFAPADLLPAIGQLLYHVVGGSALDHARARLSSDAVMHALRASDAPPLSPSSAAPPSPTAALESSLQLVGAVVLAPDGRAAVMAGVAWQGQEEEDGDAPGSVLEGLLLICQSEAAPYLLITTALRALGRLAADARYGPLLLQHRALDVAMGVLRRDREGGDTDGLPLELVAAAATLVARLTEVMITLGGDISPAPAAQTDADAIQLFAASHRRRQSMGWSDKKLDALHCAMAAHARHPDSALLFKSVVDLSVSYMRRAEQPASAQEEGGGGSSNSINAGPSPGELRLVQEAVATLQRLREESLASASRQHQQQLLVDRVWGERGARACAGCLRLARSIENQELAAGVVALLDSTAAGDGLPRALVQAGGGAAAAAAGGLHAVLVSSAALGLSAEAEAQRGRLLVLLEPFAVVTVAADEETKEEGAAEAAVAAGEDEKSVAGGDLDTSRASLFHDARAEVMLTPPPSLPAAEVPAEPEPPAPGPLQQEEPTTAPAPVEAEAEDAVTAAMGALAVAPPPPAMLPLAAASATAGPWVQCVDARRRVFFFNTDTGQAQWSAPEVMLAFWAAAAELGQPGEEGTPSATLPLACEMDGWQARFDPLTRVALCVPPPSAGPHRRYWCLPATAPPGLLGAGLLAAPPSTRRKEQEVAAEAAATTMTTNMVPPDELREEEGNPLLGDDGGNAHTGSGEGEENEEQPETELLDGLRALRDGLEHVAAEAQGQAQAAAAGALVGEHAELLRRVRARVVRTDVEEGLSSALRKALGVVEALAETSGYYIERYERELRAHEGKGLNAALEATMGTVKGEIVRHTPADLPQIVKVVGMMERLPAEKLFKESHLLVKRLVLKVAGKQGVDTYWTLSALDIQTIPAHYLTQLGQALLRLCIAYDNLSPQQKKTLTTASEIIKNKSWLVALAVRCVEAGTLHAAASPAAATTSSSSTFSSTMSSSFSSTARRAGATPPSGSKPLLGSSGASTGRAKSTTTTTTTRSSISPPAAARTSKSAAATITGSQSSIGSASHQTPPSTGTMARRGGRSPPLSGGQSTPSPAASATLPRRRTPPPPVRLSPPVATPSPRESSPRDNKGPSPGSPPFLAGKAKRRTGAGGAGGAVGAGTPSPLGMGATGERAARSSGIKPPSTPVRGSGGLGKR